MAILPPFSSDTTSSSIERFKPGIVYRRRTEPIIATIQPIPDPPDPAPLATTSEQAMMPLRRTTRISRPPDKYGYSHSAFLPLSLLLTFPLPTLTL
eukprot:TRINITY_DN25808_c0_g1_i1.p1 TRINITY_DN25808_c0_g1~~TRINITY_DN25808_c0_g1_i1.p1  ORF type:complete len:105 (+),score=8.56 TRINITY_DN25808_c0_g1_i1:29-316(+)